MDFPSDGSKPTSAPRAAETAASSLAEAAFRAAPVGLTVRDESGAALLSNLQAGQFSTPDVENLKWEAEFAFGGRRYAISAVADGGEQQRLREELFQRAYFDPLTGRANLAFFEQAIRSVAQHSENGEHFAIVTLDVDGFRNVNDYYGRAVGDALLRKIAERIEGEVRQSDLVARSGDDEFSVMIAPTDGLQEAIAATERILKRLRDPFGVDGYEIFVSASAGLALYPSHDRRLEGLRTKSLAAVSRAKREAKGELRIHDSASALVELGRAKLEQSLRLALRDRQFLCAIQPKVDFRQGRVVGAEVLSRWRDDAGEVRLPGELIGLALDIGLINEVTKLIFERTLEGLETIDRLFGPNLPLGFNLAAKQAADGAFMRKFAAMLAASGQAHRFVIELTEEAFLDGGRFETETLPILRGLGAKISIDDFGVGYSSLSKLADVTADEIKVDRSFITDIHLRPRSQSLLRAIESIGEALGMTVMVEGVETAEELDYLILATRIRVAQGFYVGKPVVIGDDGEAAAHYAPPSRVAEASRPPAAARERPQRGA